MLEHYLNSSPLNGLVPSPLCIEVVSAPDSLIPEWAPAIRLLENGIMLSGLALAKTVYRINMGGPKIDSKEEHKNYTEK